MTASVELWLHGAPGTAPDGIEDVPRLFGADASRVWGSSLERRVRNALVPLTGEGQEERTYRQWVERRMGHGAYEHVYADYGAPMGLPGEHSLLGSHACITTHEADTMAPSDGGHERYASGGCCAH